MRLLAGAVVLLAGAVLVGAGVLAEVVFVTSPQRGGAGSPPLVALAEFGGMALGFVGLVLLVSGFLRDEQDRRKGGGT
jgi:hypothetical protein